MNVVTFARSGAPEAAQAGAELVEQLRSPSPPQALIVFASSRYNYETLLQALACLQAEHLVGCSSAGEFVGAACEEGTSCAVAIHSDEMVFSSALAGSISTAPLAAAESLSEQLLGVTSQAPEHSFRTALVFCDALAGNTEVLIDEVNRRTAGLYQFVGGGAGDDAQFSKTHVFYRGQAHSNSVVLLEILSKRPVGVGVSHGWVPTGSGMRVTESKEMRVVSLNAEPAADIFCAYARETGQPLDLNNPLPFFLHNVIGIKTPAGWKLRVPLAIDPVGGTVDFASDVPAGATLSFMKTDVESSRLAAQRAFQGAKSQLGGESPGAALFFDCVATRLRMGGDFKQELTTLSDALEGASFAGYNTYGQIARAEGQFNGFHNCTAVVCLIPR